MKNPSLVIVFLLALAGNAPAAGRYLEVTYPPGTQPGELPLGVTYTLWIPGGAFWASSMQTTDPERIVALWFRSGTAFTAWEKGEIARPDIPAAALHFTDKTAPPGKAHVYRVVAVNSVGLQSEPSQLAKEPTRRFLCADSSKGRIAIIDAAGKTEWEYKIGPLHDLHMLPNGNVLFQTNWTRVVEIEPKTNRFVWEYDCAKRNGNQGKPIEVHAFQRLDDGLTLIAESGPSRIIEVDRAGKIRHEIKLQVKKSQPHVDTRLVRKTRQGTYLVCQEGDGAVKEYDAGGKIIWEYPVPLFDKQPRGGHGPEAFGNKCFTALRLPNGNTLVSTGNGHSVLEVTPKKEIVWSVHQNDLPGIQLAWVTTLQVLPNGNIVIGNCHAGDKNPQIVEITRDKKVAWTFRDFQRFGNALTNTQVLDVDGKAVK